MTPEERAARKAAKKNTPSHYRERLARLKRRAEYLRTLLNTEGRSESSRHHMMAEISALEWAVETLTPWFAKDEHPREASKMDTPETLIARLEAVLAQLRHAYTQLKNSSAENWTPRHRTMFADGLIAPQIRKLELAAHALSGATMRYPGPDDDPRIIAAKARDLEECECGHTRESHPRDLCKQFKSPTAPEQEK